MNILAMDLIKKKKTVCIQLLQWNRKIERECSRNIEVMWPINAVRTHNRANLRAQNRRKN